MLTLILIIFQLVNAFDFRHHKQPKQLAVFYWSIKDEC